MEWSNITITDMQTYFEPTPAMNKIVSLFFDAKDYKGTIKAAKKVLLFAKTDSDKFLGHFFIANSLSAMNDIDRAASEALKALKHCDNFNGSNNSVFWCHNFLGRYYVHKHMFKEAMDVLEKGRRFAGTNENLYAYYINMAKLYGRCNDFQNEFKMAQSALLYTESDVEIADCYLQMAASEVELSEFDLKGHGQEAIKYSRLCLDYVEKSLSVNKGDTLSLRSMARLCYRMMCTIYEERGEKDKAAEQVKRALEYTDEGGEEEKEAYMSLVYYDIGQKNVDATENLRMLLCCCDTKKEKYDICHELSMKYTKCDDLQNAIRIEQIALQYAETNVKLDESYASLSFLYQEIGEKSKAIEAANNALQYVDGSRNKEKIMYEVIADCSEDRKDGSAIKSLQTLLCYYDTDEEKAHVHYRLARQYMNIDDWEKTREEYAIAVKLNPIREYIVDLLELYHIDENIQACKDLILKYGVHKDDPGITDYVKNDPELKKYLK